MAAGAYWLAGWAQAVPCLTAQILLYQPVFQRVEGDHRQPSAGRQRLERLRQRGLQRFQLLVDRHAQRLEGARRRMDIAAAGGPCHYPGQLPGGMQRAGLDDGPRHLARPPLFPIAEDDIGQFRFGQLVHQVGRAHRAVGVKAHVQRRLSLEREAALGRIQLHG